MTPLVFPGGDLSEMGVNGTVNDLAMSGAKPLFLSAAFIVEEGLPMEDLSSIVKSMSRAARNAGVCIVTGDRKVVSCGSADRLFITTSGVGLGRDGTKISASNVRPGDRVIVSGSVADHGMAVMSLREGMEVESGSRSDAAPLHALVAAMMNAGDVHALRDPTRGGLRTSLCEIAASSAIGVEIGASEILIREEVRGACELLGIDPLFVVNEGKLVAFVAPESSDAIVRAMRELPEGKDARAIGKAVRIMREWCC